MSEKTYREQEAAGREMPFQLKDLTKEFQNKLSTEVGNYSIPLILNWDFIGSGTLIRFGECFGILTASHVVSNDNWEVDCGANSVQVLRVSVAEHAHDLSIETRRLQIERTDRISDEYGPDLAFIRIPESEFLHAIIPRKSFLDIRWKREEKYEQACDSRGVAVFSGFPDVAKFEAPPELGFGVVHGLMGYGFFTGRERYEERDGYDYVDVGASYAAGTGAPVSFRGVSGGGLWQVPVFRKEGDQPGQEFYEGLYLSGVMIYQSPIENDYRRIRAHGPSSLFKMFFPQLEARFSQ